MTGTETPERIGDIEVLDLHPDLGNLVEDAIAGLTGRPRMLPCKWLYDERGSQIFDAICALPEYYPTRTEIAIYARYLPEMAARLGPSCLVVEPGAGSLTKTRQLMQHLSDPAGLVVLDISREHLIKSAHELATHLPGISVQAVCADYTQPLRLPTPPVAPQRIAAFFPGSTIGNFTHAQAVAFLTRLRSLVGQGGACLIGVDLVKDPAVIHAAYNDSAGVTAAFNLNLLERLNRDIDGAFPLDAFQHDAPWNPIDQRIEMHLVATRDIDLHIGDRHIAIQAGERICTEHSHKYSVDSFEALADEADFRREQTWIDDDGLFSVHYLVGC